MSQIASYSRFGMLLLLVGVLLGIAIGWATAGPPVNAEENVQDPGPSVQPAGVQTFYKRVAGTSFLARASSIVYGAESPGCISLLDNDSPAYFVYDLQLPQGAIIDYLSLYYYDGIADADMQARILALDDEGKETIVRTLYSTGSGGYGSTGSGIFSYEVDNYSEALQVHLRIPGGYWYDMRFCGIRLRYQFDISGNYLPAIMNMATP